VRTSDLVEQMSNPYVRIDDLIGVPVYVKNEAYNLAGSIKLRPALQMVRGLEARGVLRPGRAVIESSSGNLGIALSMICARLKYPFTCVVDPNASQRSIKLMAASGTQVITVRERDAAGGYLGTRIDTIQRLCSLDPQLVWVNQYSNPDNWRAHYEYTAPAIAAAFARLDWLFIAAGTTGTLMGCIRYFRESGRRTRIVAVDATGSVIFGGPSGARLIPGMGASKVPPLLDKTFVSEVVYIDEAQTVGLCRKMARQGIVLGGSAGSVLAAVERYRKEIRDDDVVVAVAPDSGEKYLDTIYDDQWVGTHFPGVLAEPNRTSRTAAATVVEASALALVPFSTVRSVLVGKEQSVVSMVRQAYLAHHEGRTSDPTSRFIRFPDSERNRIIALPSCLYSADSQHVVGVKWISSFPENRQRGLPRASGLLILNDPRTGHPEAVMDAGFISAERTAASAALGASLLSTCEEMTDPIGFIGAGVIARHTFRYLIATGRRPAVVNVFDSDSGCARAFLRFLSDAGVRAESHQAPSDLVRASRLIVFATTAVTPYVTDSSLFSHWPLVLHLSLRDLAPALVVECHNVVDDAVECFTAGTSVHLARQQFGSDAINPLTIGALIAGAAPPERYRPVVFSPFGLGILDMAVGKFVLEQAAAQGLLQRIPNFFPVDLIAGDEPEPAR
jgi:N-(2-amino-2-carboxyethyl)-L-glutamate synthase